MIFFLALALLNIACFLPLYLLNLAEQANPFAFLKGSGTFGKATARLLYARMRFSDPFRINFDFTFLLLIASYFQFAPFWAVPALAAILFITVLEIGYTTIMHVIFRRAPSIASDLALLRVGWSVTHTHRYLVALLAIAVLLGLGWLAVLASGFLYRAAPAASPATLALAAILALPCFYHWKSFRYSAFIWRTVYSATLHMIRNVGFSRRSQDILSRDAAHFEGLNCYRDVALVQRPNVVLLCIESYGSLLVRDATLDSAYSERTLATLARLQSGGYGIASNLSEAPIFAGGSWLSFSTLTYGTLFDDAHVHDSLFSIDSSFGNYESLFHILERNGYSNNLLCPLGGVSSRYVNWDSIDRCFRPQRKFDFDSLGFEGQSHDFFVQHDLVAPPDQYSLNYAYESIRAAESDPFSLFFCTLNSHYPWTTDVALVDDWTALNRPGAPTAATPKARDVRAAYVHAIRYQLDYIFDFVERNADDDLLVVIFGDHQPPFITPAAMGKETPVHVLSRSKALLAEFFRHGFAETLDLGGRDIVPIRHEAFLSLLMRGLNSAYGKNPQAVIDYRGHGTRLVPENG